MIESAGGGKEAGVAEYELAPEEVQVTNVRS